MNVDNNIDAKVLKTEIPLVVSTNSMDITTNSTVQSLAEPVSQYLPINSIAVNNTTQMADMSSIPMLIQESIPSTQMSTINGEQSLSLVEPLVSVPTDIEVKQTVPLESDAMKSIISQNPVLTSVANNTPTTQANNISALSEMSDAELLCFINPATFDQI